MKDYLLIFAVIFLTFSGCNKTNTSESDAPAVKENSLQVEDDISAMDQGRQSDTKAALRHLLDSSDWAQSDFDQYFESYLYSADAGIEKAADSTAIHIFHRIVDSKVDNFDQLPLFEVKGTEKVILIAIGQGIQAFILIDKQTKTMLNIEFLPSSKTSRLGAKVETFKNQFIGSTVNFTNKNFGLVPWDKQSKTGDVQIDGISGATDLCQTTVDVLNQQLKSYRGYFDD